MHIGLTNYKDAFSQLNMPLNNEALFNLSKIEQQGWTEKDICYAIFMSIKKLSFYGCTSMFWSTLLDEVKKHSFNINDPMWDEIKIIKLAEL